jgi:hypothetical protein
MRNIILELGDEDDYGSWELWWRVAQAYPGENRNLLKIEFARTIQQLVQEREIKAKRHGTGPSGELAEVSLDIQVLMDEINRADNPDPASFYWFGR